MLVVCIYHSKNWSGVCPVYGGDNRFAEYCHPTNRLLVDMFYIHTHIETMSNTPRKFASLIDEQISCTDFVFLIYCGYSSSLCQ